MSYYNGPMHQHIQLLPQEPQMQGFIGANAIFIPSAVVANTNGIINYNALAKSNSIISYLYGELNHQNQHPAISIQLQ